MLFHYFSSNSTVAMDSNKQQRSPEPFSSLSQSLQYLQHIANESNKGKDEFSLIAEDENKRAQQIAEKENQRILQERRTNGTIKICPLCLDEISAIISHEERRPETCGVRMLCCGVMHCTNCREKSMDFMYGKSRNDRTNSKCYNCREPLRNSMTSWARVWE